MFLQQMETINEIFCGRSASLSDCLLPEERNQNVSSASGIIQEFFVAEEGTEIRGGESR